MSTAARPVDPAGGVRPPTRRPLRRRVMHAIRRGHLYVGLFMIPWVLVYAVTGFLLNHDTVWAGGTVHRVTPDHLAGTGLDALPALPDEIAREVTAELNARTGRPAYRLADPPAARFDPDYLPVQATIGGKEVRLNLDPATRSGHYTVPHHSADAPPPAPFAAAEGVWCRDKLSDRVKSGGPVVFGRAGTPVEKCELNYTVTVAFAVTDEAGRTWKVSYDPDKGSVTGRPADATGDTAGAREFLFNLHFTAGFPESVRARWAWAVFVDLTVLALVFWCGSGLVMWWQIKAVRRAGVVVLAASVLTAAAIGLAMHGAFHS
ncbi:MAG: PepSY domain-containing protein [Gemmataceae bacterium]|nr:PepSY domain-containing protein [Gemmataceae bacterium]